MNSNLYICKTRDLFDSAYKSLSQASCDVVMGTSDSSPKDFHMVDVDNAIAHAESALILMKQIRKVRDKEVTVNLGDANGMADESETVLLAE